MDLAQRLEVRKIVVTVTNKNIDLGNILHFATGRFNHSFEVLQYLFVLPYQVARGNVALCIAAGLSGQKKELSARDENAMAEASRSRQLRRIDDGLLHEY